MNGSHREISRRHLLATGGAMAVTLAWNGSGHGAVARNIPVALQLWSVRKDCEKDLDGTLARVAELGFAGVEFAGYFGYQRNPEGLRKKLDQLHLTAAGTHIRVESFSDGQFADTVAFHKILGCKFLIVPGDKRFTDPKGNIEYAGVMNRAAQALAPHGMFCGHHNHTEEFKKVGPVTFWDEFATHTSKTVILQQDVGWSTVAGQDPVALVRRYPSRTRSAHFKAKLPKGQDRTKKPIIGQDTIDWRALITACTEVGGTEWFVLEQEDYPDGLTPFQSVQASFAGLKKILAG
jgi:sugar phosphate isomerase/epimerase